MITNKDLEYLKSFNSNCIFTVKGSETAMKMVIDGNTPWLTAYHLRYKIKEITITPEKSYHFSCLCKRTGDDRDVLHKFKLTAYAKCGK